MQERTTDSDGQVGTGEGGSRTLAVLTKRRLGRRQFLRLAGIAGVGATGLALAGCGDDDEEEPAAAQAAPAEPEQVEKTATVKVGLIVSLSGAVLAFDTPQATASRMAFDQINQAGGVVVGDTRYTMEPIVRDSRSETSTAVALAKELINDLGVQYFFGPLFDADSVAVQELTNPAKVIYMVGATSIGQFLTPDSVAPGGDKRYLFKTQASDFIQKRAFIQGIRDFVPDAKSAISLHRNDALGQFMFPAVEQEFVDAGFDFLGIETFPPDTTDWSPILTRIKDQNPDVIMFQWNGPVEVAAVQQAIELGVGHSYYLNLIDPAVILEDLGSRDEVVVSGCIPICWGAPSNQKISDFWDAYRVATGKQELGPAEGIAGLAYDAPFLLAEAWKAAGTVTDTDAVVAALENVTYDGLMGKLRFDDRHTLLTGYEICAVRNGQITCNFYELGPDGRMAPTSSSADRP